MKRRFWNRAWKATKPTVQSAILPPNGLLQAMRLLKSPHRWPWALDRGGASNILWYIHFLACFIGLAYLPFSKMFHIISTPCESSCQCGYGQGRIGSQSISPQDRPWNWMPVPIAAPAACDALHPRLSMSWAMNTYSLRRR